MLPSTAEYKKG